MATSSSFRRRADLCLSLARVWSNAREAENLTLQAAQYLEEAAALESHLPSPVGLQRRRRAEDELH
jgi:hypothetical protein